MCPHTPPCPDARALDREAAKTVVSRPEQGWSLLCNGVVVFDDTGELLPDGSAIAPHRPAVCRTRTRTNTLRPRRSAQTNAGRFAVGTDFPSVNAVRCVPRSGRNAA